MWSKIGPYDTYGFIYCAGILIHFVITFVLCKKLGLRRRVGILISICYVVGMTIGAKILYDVQHGGLNIPALLTYEHYERGGLWGGPLVYLALAVPLVLLLAGNKRPTLDLVAVSLPIPMIIAKLACVAHGCCFGVESDMPWAITYPESVPAPANIPIHPTPIYEILVLVSIFVVMKVLDPRKCRGTLLLWFLVLYGVGRATSEIWRGDLDDRPNIGGISTSQMVCLGAAILSIILLWKYRLTTERIQPSTVDAQIDDLPLEGDET